MRELTLPRLSQGMESGVIVRWLRAEGEAFEAGDVLYEIDTDKTTQEVEAEAAGILVRIVVPQGEQPVGATIAYLDDLGGGGTPATRADEPRRVLATPRARRLAREAGIDVRQVAGTGPSGRVTSADISGTPKRTEEARASSRASADPAPGSILLEAMVDGSRIDSLVAAAERFEPTAGFVRTDYLVRVTAAALRLAPLALGGREGELRVIAAGPERADYDVAAEGLTVRGAADARRGGRAASRPIATLYDLTGASVARAVVTADAGESLVVTFAGGADRLTVAVSLSRELASVDVAEAFFRTLLLLVEEPAAAL